MATGGPSDSNAKIDLQTLWPEKDVQFMASMLRGTGKFHVVPIYETEDELTYVEEVNETKIPLRLCIQQLLSSLVARPRITGLSNHLHPRRHPHSWYASTPGPQPHI